MSRVLCVQGLPNADGIHCNFLPFKVEQLDDVTNPDSTPTGSTPGEWAMTDFGYALCVDELSIKRCFGLHRRFKTRFSMTGQYVAYNEFDGPGDLTPFTFDTGTDPAVDLVKPAHTGDERFLGHGRSLFQSDSGTVDGATTCAASINLGYRADLGSRAFDPTNTDPPLQNFDTNAYDPTRINVPYVLYSNALAAYYITLMDGSALPLFPSGSAAIQVRNFLGTVSYKVEWKPGPPSSDPFSAVYNIHFAPFGDIPGNIFWPENFEPVIDEFIVSIEATDATGYFPHAKLDSTEPIWDETTGSQLITPIPLVQN